MTYQRFTVFTQDATVEYTTNRKRRFTWKLHGNKVYNDVKSLKMSIESVHCRNMSIIVDGDQNKVFQQGVIPPGGDGVNVITQKTIAMGNTDEKEMYSIRCNSVSSFDNIDTRPDSYKSSPIIYVGSLDYHNNNTKDSYCYEVKRDILTSDFTLDIDTNYKNPTTNVDSFGIAPNLEIAITFILYPE